MNTLSWMIYIGGLSEPIILFTVSYVIAFTFLLVMNPNNKNFRTYLVSHIIITVILSIICILIPSKNTMYDIIISEMGEKVVNSEIASKSEKAIIKWLDSQTETKK